jgi:hypothetical protein
MYIKHFFPVYKSEIGISDGVQGICTKADEIICREKDGRRQILEIGMHHGHRAIRGWKVIEKGKIVEWLKYGAFQRWYTKEGYKNIIRYHPDSNMRLHGVAECRDSMSGQMPVKTLTRFSWGKFLRQKAFYLNRHLAYEFHRNDKSVIMYHNNGKRLAVIYCPGGFEVDVKAGNIFIDLKGIRTARAIDFSKDGYCWFIFYDRRGKVEHKGEYRNRQRVGNWIVSGKPVYFINGVPVPKKLWDTPPDQLKVDKILRIKNAQLRAALMARIGPANLFKKLRHKIIDQQRNGNLLVQLPIKVDEGNGRRGASFKRILRVKCPSTKNFYYLEVPDFIRSGGKVIKLDKAETARQWTFNNDQPNKRIKFALET